MLEEEIEFHGIDKCKLVELPDEQEIEGCIYRETVGSPEMFVRTACEQEECIEEEICDRSLPKIFRSEESVHKDEIKLEINAVEISESPRDVKLEMPLEQSEPKLVQNVNLVSDIPTPFHAEQEIFLPNQTIDLWKAEGGIPVPSKNIPGKPTPKLHTRQRKVLGSELVRRVNPTRLVKRKILSMCRSPPKLPDRQNSLNDKASNRVLPKIYYTSEETANYQPPPKPPFIQNINGEVIGITENVVPKTRPPPKLPRIHGKDDREGIRDLEKECLLDTELNYRHPLKGL